MVNYDIYIQILNDLKKYISKESDFTSQIDAIKEINQENDVIQSIEYSIHVDLDWIIKIEDTLDAIDSCIKQEREFIDSRGSVERIENVKNISKESITHLAKHVNLIKKTENGKIIPEELYTVEKLSDYALYENKFIYMLLIYLRDFTTYRYNNISQYYHKYHGKLNLDKKIDIGNRKFNFQVNLEEERNYNFKDDAYLDSILTRISGLLTSITSFLSTPLMVEMSKYPMIKQPIVPTNILKMDPDFVKLNDLYNFIISYEKDGYEIEKNIRKITPLKDDDASIFAELIELSGFLTYKIIYNLDKQLKDQYEEHLKNKFKEDNLKKIQAIKLLKKKVLNSGQNIEEYVLELENRNKVLEGYGEEINGLNDIIYSLKQDITNLENINSGLENYIKTNKYVLEKNEELESMKSAYEESIMKLKLNHEAEIQDISDSLSDKVDVIYKEKLDNYKITIDKYKETIKSLNEEVSLLKDSLEESNDKLKDVTEFTKVIYDEKLILLSKINAMRYKQHLEPLDEVDFTDEKNFKELEKELATFQKMFKKEWQKTKKQIYNDMKEKYLKNSKKDA